MENEGEKALRKSAAYCLRQAALAAFVLLTAALALCAVALTARNEVGDNIMLQTVTLVREPLLRSLLLSLAALAALLGVHGLLERLGGVRLGAGLCALWLAAALLWIWAIGMRQRADAQMVLADAHQFARNHYDALSGDYLQVYTYQLGIALPLHMLARLFSGATMGQLDFLAQCVNAALGIAGAGVLAALAQVAAENNYCRPVVDDSDELTITEGRHPVVEQMLKGSLFVPNDTRLNCTTDRCLIITGPNMAGKSTYMRQNALIALMAQIGSFVPASSCHVGVVDAIFTRIGASDDLAAGQSTFMVEMTEVAEILKNATPKSLVVLDEIGRGTSTFDGMSIARAVVEHISDPAKGLGCKTLFATHYHELTDLEGAIEGVKNYNIAVKKRGEDITFLRRIIRGPADDSYGIEVAKLAGLPGTVTRRAHEVLRTLEASAPKNKVEQMDFDALQEYSSPAVPSEMMEKLEALDVETLTPIEALNFLYELKKTLSGSLNG